ncbi:hypothetical protein QQF64_032275 [Cirrhinus molitorella]
MTQRKDIWDHKTKWKSGSRKTLNVHENFHMLETLKTSGPSVPICLEFIETKGSYHLSSGWKLAGNGNHQTFKSRKVLMPKGNDGRTLTKSSSLPPIYGPRISTILMSSAKTCVSSWGVGCQEKKANILSTSVRMDKALFSRQKQGCQLICNGLAVFNDGVQVQNQDLRQDSLKISDASAGQPQDGYLDIEPSAKDKKVMIEKSVSRDRPAQPFSDSAIEMENENEMIDSQEDEYYTNQRITAWIAKVNASLFSPLKDEIIDQILEEQDVDTIKIIYDQD